MSAVGDVFMIATGLIYVWRTVRGWIVCPPSNAD